MVGDFTVASYSKMKMDAANIAYGVVRRVGIVLFLARRLNLKLQTGDRFEISVIETADGNVTLGISAPDRKPFRKAIVSDDEILAAKHVGSSRRRLKTAQTAPPQSQPFIERRRAR